MTITSNLKHCSTIAQQNDIVIILLIKIIPYQIVK